jgi:hypothetical protein
VDSAGTASTIVSGDRDVTATGAATDRRHRSTF